MCIECTDHTLRSLRSLVRVLDFPLSYAGQHWQEHSFGRRLGMMTGGFSLPTGDSGSGSGFELDLDTGSGSGLINHQNEPRAMRVPSFPKISS